MSLAPPLPERVRLRVVAMVSDVLPDVTPLPAALRKVAGFTPARRARLGGTAIWSALEDEEFRARAATQVAGRDAGGADQEDPVGIAARAWLVREEGWEEAVAEALSHLEEDPGAGDRSALEMERLRHQVLGLQQQVREQAARHRAELDEAKANHTTLRRRLGEARAQLREAEAQRDEAVTAREAAEAAAAAAVRGAEQDLRRLRAQLDELSASTAAGRRETRSERDQATLRARLLLEALSEAAAGLRRELALPAVAGAPADAVEADLLGDERPRMSGSPATAAGLDQLLALPRARLIIDGYNVTKQAWESATLEAQRSRLVTSLAALVARTGAETTVVFDAADSPSRPVVPAPRGVRVVFSPVGVIADDVIRQLVEAEPHGRVVVVVTSDQALARDTARSGARVVPSSVLTDLLGR